MTDAPFDPAADDGQEARQEGQRINGRDRGFWWKIRQDAPEPPQPHPAPIRTSRDPGARGTFLPNTGLRGWSTLAHRVGPGWAITETYAIGYRLMARGKVGELAETIGVRARHAATGANAVAFLMRPFTGPTTDLDPDRKPWGFESGMAWVEDPETRRPIGLTSILGRPFAAALKGEPPLITDRHGRQVWPPTDDEET